MQVVSCFVKRASGENGPLESNPLAASDSAARGDRIARDRPP
jgi:hypothetical protein